MIIVLCSRDGLHGNEAEGLKLQMVEKRCMYLREGKQQPMEVAGSGPLTTVFPSLLISIPWHYVVLDLLFRVLYIDLEIYGQNFADSYCSQTCIRTYKQCTHESYKKYALCSVDSAYTACQGSSFLPILQVPSDTWPPRCWMRPLTPLCLHPSNKQTCTRWALYCGRCHSAV